MEKLYNFDCTLHQLKNLNGHEEAYPLLSFLKELWIDPYPGREFSTLIGNCYVYTDDNNHLHMDFVSKVNTTPEMKKKINKKVEQVLRSKDDAYARFLEKGNKDDRD